MVNACVKCAKGTPHPWHDSGTPNPADTGPFAKPVWRDGQWETASPPICLNPPCKCPLIPKPGDTPRPDAAEFHATRDTVDLLGI